MVLVQSAPKFRSFHVHPNPARIVALAGAIALNMAIVMALLIPMDLPLPKLSSENIVVVDLPKRVDPPPEPPVVPVTPPRPERPQPVQRAVVPPVEVPPVVTEEARIVDMPYVPPVESTPPAAPDIGATGPVSGVRLEYASAPPPTYPREELMAGHQGTVLLQVLVDVDGTPLEVTIHASSGNRRLDRAAQQQVLRHWTFRPATRDGRPIQAIGLVPIDFRLQ